MRVAIIAPAFGSPFRISILDNFKKLLRPEEMAQAAYALIVVNKGSILLQPQKDIFIPELIIRKSA